MDYGLSLTSFTLFIRILVLIYIILSDYHLELGLIILKISLLISYSVYMSDSLLLSLLVLDQFSKQEKKAGFHSFSESVQQLNYLRV